MNVYQLDDGEQHFYAAETKEAAIRMHLEPLFPPGGLPDDLSTVNDKIEYNLGCKLEEIEVGELPPDRELPVRDEDTDTVQRKTAAEWASEGAGLIATTAY